MNNVDLTSNGILKGFNPRGNISFVDVMRRTFRSSMNNYRGRWISSIRTFFKFNDTQTCDRCGGSLSYDGIWWKQETLCKDCEKQFTSTFTYITGGDVLKKYKIAEKMKLDQRDSEIRRKITLSY